MTSIRTWRPAKAALLSLLVVAVATRTATSQTTPPPNPAADSAGIRQAALDYIEGYYEANGERMERALHPELAKRIVRTDPKTGRSSFGTMSALTLINGTKAGGGRNTPEAQRRREVRILDIFEGAAVARIDASNWVDYLQLARWNGRWVIVNVLWELRPEGS